MFLARTAWPAVAPLPPAAANRARIETVRQKAVASYQRGDYDQAIRYYEEWSRLDPKNPLVLKDLMWALRDRKYTSEAAAVAREILGLRPKDPDALKLLGRSSEAESADRAQAMRRKAGELAVRGDWAEAAALYRELMTQAPSDSTIAPKFLSCLRRLGQFQEGAAVAAELTQARPQDPESWNWLGHMESGLEHGDLAVSAYQRSLELAPDQPKIRVALGTLHINMRDFDRAIAVLSPLSGDDKGMAKAHVLLAKAQYWKRDYAQAALNWSKANQKFPDNAEYGLYETKSALYQLQEAKERLKSTALSQKQSRALEFLSDDLFMQGDMPEAQRLLEESLKTMTPADEARALKLAELYQKSGNTAKWGVIVNRVLDILPQDLEALEMKAAQLIETGQPQKALEVYKEMRRLNPHCLPALLGIVSVEMRLGHKAQAAQAARQLSAAETANPYTVLNTASLLYEAGEPRQAKRLLQDWLDDNPDHTVLPVLLYHGLTPFAKDPLLAYPYHMSLSVFEDQMRALHDAGYAPVTAAQVARWYYDRTPLPPKPILITFDDGRLDSLTYADPILSQHRLKATMFAALVNVEGQSSPGFASWTTLRQFHNTGRWEIQSHGNNAHRRIPTSPEGEQGRFLLNRQWLAAEGRLETEEEWRRRIVEDHERGKQLIAQNIGEVPCAFAFPEGYYGQQGNSNVPEAAPINLELTRDSFQTSYVQDGYGLNVHTDNTALLRRLIPENTWTGKDLVRYLENNNPFNRVYLQRAHWALDEGHPHEALRWLRQLEANGASPGKLLAEQAQLQFAADNPVQGRQLARRALAMEDLPEAAQLISSGTVPAWLPTYLYQRDNQDRSNWILDQTFDVAHTGVVKWSLRHQRGEYMHSNAPTVVDNAGGISLDIPLGLFHHFSAEGLAHFLTGSPQNTYSLNGGLQSRWTDEFKTQLQGGHALYNTNALALANNVGADYGDLLARWNQKDGPWQISARGRGSALTDGNRRLTAWLEGSRELVAFGHLRAAARLTYDDMRALSPNYYSPQGLRMAALGPEFSFPLRRNLELTARYMPAYAQESGRSRRYESDTEASLIWRISDRATLQPSYEYYTAPGYSNSIYMAQFELHF